MRHWPGNGKIATFTPSLTLPPPFDKLRTGKWERKIPSPSMGEG
jgi:hypothetical protein